MEKFFSFRKKLPEEIKPLELTQTSIESTPDSSDELFDEMQSLFAQEQNLFKILASDKTEELIPVLEKAKETEQTHLLLKNILERGRKETNFFDGLIETDIYQALIEGDLEASKINGIRIAWRKKMENKKFAASYEHLKGVKIGDGPSSLLSLVTTLSLSGELPDGIKTLYHELIHSRQFSYTESWKTVLRDAGQRGKKYDHNPVELQEAQAYRTADFPARNSSHQDIITKMRGSYDTDPEKLEYALEAIDRLQAVGFTIDEIGKLIILPQKWDEQKHVYPEIEAAISAKLREQKRRDIDIHPLKQIYRLKQSIDSTKIALIAREELRKWKAEQDAKKQAQSPSV